MILLLLEKSGGSILRSAVDSNIEIILLHELNPILVLTKAKKDKLFQPKETQLIWFFKSWNIWTLSFASPKWCFRPIPMWCFGPIPTSSNPRPTIPFPPLSTASPEVKYLIKTRSCQKQQPTKEPKLPPIATQFGFWNNITFLTIHYWTKFPSKEQCESLNNWHFINLNK